MSVRDSAVGTSRYRQLRITATHELSGRFSVSVYAKGLNQEWHERQCMYRGVAEGTLRPLNTTEDVLAALVAVLEQQMLPSGPG